MQASNRSLTYLLLRDLRMPEGSKQHLKLIGVIDDDTRRDSAVSVMRLFPHSALGHRSHVVMAIFWAGKGQNTAESAAPAAADWVLMIILLIA